MNYADIKTVDIQDGTGVRVSIYVSGCHFHCKGCHNKEAWDFNYGKRFDNSTIEYILNAMDHDYIAGLSILGGEPLEPINQKALVPLVKRVKAKFPNKNIWCYTGYKFEEDILGKMYKKYEYTRELINNIDIIVDGEFIEEKSMADLKFRGSTNQKKIDVKATLKLGSIVQLKFGDEARYEEVAKEIKKPKVIFFKEFQKETIEVAEEEKVSVAIPTISNDNDIPVIPAYEIKKVEEKIVAKNIDENLENEL